MESTISGLLTCYETGKLTRRDLIRGLALLAAAGTTASSAAAAAPRGITLDHIALQVSDVKRSRDFYVKVFGLVENTSPRANSSLRVDFPQGGFLTLQDFKPGGQLDHLAIKLENFNKATVTEQLKAYGITPIDLPASAAGGAGFHVLDPDGFRVQIQ
jgi:catechol 2,3-dioxygenase-like lactoylglutathione lyase family enzyme